MNRARGDVIAKVADLSREEVASPITRAAASQKDRAARTANDRANILRKWFDLMMEHADNPATILRAEQE